MKRLSLFFYNQSMSLTILKEPYSDEQLEFDELTGRYQLKLGFVKNEFDMTFKSDGVLKRRIKNNSKTVYHFLYMRSNSANYFVLDFLLRRTEEGRKFLLEILLEQMEADLETGYNDIAKQPAINFANGQVMNRDEIQRNLVSVATENLIYSSSKFFGFNAITQAVLPSQLFMIAQRNTKE